MPDISETVWNLAQTFYEKTNERPKSLYVGGGEYAQIRAENKEYFKPAFENQNQEMFMGFALYRVDFENHLKVGF